VSRVILSNCKFWKTYDLIKREEREEREKRKIERKGLWRHIEILMTVPSVTLKKIWRLVGYTSGPKVNESWHLWMTHVTYSVHRLWPSLLLDSSRRDLFNGTNGVIIGVLICLKDFSLSFFLYLFFFSLLSPPCNLWRGRIEKKVKIKQRDPGVTPKLRWRHH
jgi:hypothetical protein